MKPFNLQEALAGKPVITRAGKTVTKLVAFDIPDGKYPLVASIYGRDSVEVYTLSGEFFTTYGKNRASDYDLFMASTKKTGWMNVYREDLGFHTDDNIFVCNFSGKVLHPTRARADERQLPERVDCVQISWEE
jgi:hypothetical protein